MLTGLNCINAKTTVPVMHTIMECGCQ